MYFSQCLLLKYPVSLLGLVVVGVTVLFGVGGLLLVRRFVHPSSLKEHHDIADPMLGVIGTVYAVLISFVVIMVWQQFDKSNANIKTEANYMADICRDAEAFSPEFSRNISVLIGKYRDSVVKDEWKTMARGEMSNETESLMNKIWSAYTTYRPRNVTEQAFFAESVGKLNSFRELRRQRLMDAKAGVEPLLWFVLIIGAMATISFTFLFGAENLNAQVIMVFLLSVLIGLMLFTIMELDFPFTGAVSISSEPFRQVLFN